METRKDSMRIKSKLLTEALVNDPRMSVIEGTANFFVGCVVMLSVAVYWLLSMSFNHFTPWAFGLSLVIGAVGYVAGLRVPSHPSSFFILSACLALTASLHVHAAYGQLEYHFGFFTLMGVLVYYRSLLPIIAFTLTAAAAHVIADKLQVLGFDCYAFKGPFAGWPAISLHFSYLIVSAVLFGSLALAMKKHAEVADQLSQILTSFKADGRVDLMQTFDEGKPGAGGKFSKVFNEYASNMRTIVGAFYELNHDIRSLASTERVIRDKSKIQVEVVKRTLEKANNMARLASDVQQDMHECTLEIVNKDFTLPSLNHQTNQFQSNLDSSAVLAEKVRSGVSAFNLRTQDLNATFESTKAYLTGLSLKAVDHQSISVEDLQEIISRLDSLKMELDLVTWDAYGATNLMLELQVKIDDAIATGQGMTKEFMEMVSFFLRLNEKLTSLNHSVITLAQESNHILSSSDTLSYATFNSVEALDTAAQSITRAATVVNGMKRLLDKFIV